jgi:acylphosphatase
VGFRAFVWREAANLGVDGWVRNRTDGTVEALVHGTAEVVALLCAKIEEGPRWGRVDDVEVTDEPDAGSPAGGFVIRADR